MKILKLTFASLSLPLGVTSLINLDIPMKQKKQDINQELENSKSDNISENINQVSDNIDMSNVFEWINNKYDDIKNFWIINSELFNQVDWENSIRIDNQNRSVKISIVYKDSHLVFSNYLLAEKHDKIVNILSQYNNYLTF